MSFDIEELDGLVQIYVKVRDFLKVVAIFADSVERLMFVMEDVEWLERVRR